MHNQPILGFKKEPFCYLSNMHLVKVNFEGLTFNSVESAYQAAKTLDIDIRKQIRNLPSPYSAKRMCSSLVIRQDWHQIKLQVMEDLLRQKFNTPPLNIKLKVTGTCHIEEVNSWGDTYWGTCKGNGDNHLGKLIMKIREEL